MMERLLDMTNIDKYGDSEMWFEVHMLCPHCDRWTYIGACDTPEEAEDSLRECEELNPDVRFKIARKYGLRN